MKHYYKIHDNGSIKEVASYKVILLKAEGNREVYLDPPSEGWILLEEPTIDYPLWNGSEWVQDQTQATLARKQELLELLSDSDKTIPRLLEDLIDVMIAKGILSEQSIDAKARERLATKKELRKQLKELS